MDYLATYLDAYIRYHASDMQLHIDTEAAYPVLPKSWSRITGFYHLTNTPYTSDIFFSNGVIFVEWKKLRHVLSSAVEAEVCVVFRNSRM